MKDSTASGLTGLLSLIGAAISVYLAQAHITVKSGEKAGGVCDLGATLNCDAAAASAYSTIAGVPIAIVGLAGYVACVALVGWYLSQKAPRSKDPISIAGTLQTFFGVSVVYSVFLAVVSILVLPAICPACVALYVVNIIGLVLTTLWTGRGPLSTLGAQLKDLGKALGQPAALGFVAIVVAVVVLGTGYTNAAIDRSSGATPQAKPTKRIAPEKLYAAHAPARGPADAPVKLVVFSDFQCPYCSRFAKTLTFAEETFGPQLRIEFRHYPLPFHQFAAMASAIGHCAQRQGMFWEWHDTLFADQSRVNPAAMRELVGEMGMDTDAIFRCVDEPETQSVLKLDHATGESAGVTGTPAFLVNGKFYNGALPIEELTRVIESELSAAAATAQSKDTAPN